MEDFMTNILIVNYYFAFLHIQLEFTVTEFSYNPV